MRRMVAVKDLELRIAREKLGNLRQQEGFNRWQEHVEQQSTTRITTFKWWLAFNRYHRRRRHMDLAHGRWLWGGLEASLARFRRNAQVCRESKIMLLRGLSYNMRQAAQKCVRQWQWYTASLLEQDITGLVTVRAVIQKAKQHLEASFALWRRCLQTKDSACKGLSTATAHAFLQGAREAWWKWMRYCEERMRRSGLSMRGLLFLVRGRVMSSLHRWRDVALAGVHLSCPDHPCNRSPYQYGATETVTVDLCIARSRRSSFLATGRPPLTTMHATPVLHHMASLLPQKGLFHGRAS